MMMMKLDDSDRPEGQIEVLVDLGVPYVRLADYRAMQRRCADELAALKGFDPVKALALMGERDSAIRGLETARREFNRQLAETVEYYRQVNSDTEAEQLRARVAELESQLAAQQWRPVTEDWPPYNERVIIGHGGGYGGGWFAFAQRVRADNRNEDDWLMDDDTLLAFESAVVAMQRPLPPAPQEPE